MGKDVETIIGYWKSPDSSDIPNTSGPDGHKDLLLGHRDEDTRAVFAKDIRGDETSYSLDTHGFAIGKLPTKERSVTDLEAIQTEYWSEIVGFLKDFTGGKEVFVGAQIIRAFARDELSAQQFIPGQVQGPSPRAHVDVGPDQKHASLFMDRLWPQEGKLLQKSGGRFQILSIWRPIKHVYRDPLAFTDSRSVPDDDYRELDARPRYVASLLKAGVGGHKWFYCSDMEPNEVAIVKHYDSKRDIPAWRCAHTSIPLPGTEDLPARESIEVRALVCY